MNGEIKTQRRQSNEGQISYKEITSKLSNSEKRWVSPTFAKTTDNPPYANYPSVTDGMDRTTIITDSYMNKTERNTKFLHKKCYYGDTTLQEMPWIKSNIDLTFPDIKRVQLETD